MAGGNGGEDKDDSVSVRRFPIRNMNVMNPLDSTDNQIDDTVNRRRAARMHSLLQVQFSFELCLHFEGGVQIITVVP